MATDNWVNIHSANGFLPEQKLLTHQQWNTVVFTCFQFQMNLISNMCLDITLLELLPHIPGANELTELVWSNNLDGWPNMNNCKLVCYLVL